MSQVITQSQTANKNAPIKKLSLQEYREKMDNEWDVMVLDRLDREMNELYAEEIEAERIAYMEEREAERAKDTSSSDIFKALNALAKEQEQKAKELGVNPECLMFNINVSTGKCKKCKRAEAVFTGNYCKRCYYSY